MVTKKSSKILTRITIIIVFIVLVSIAGFNVYQSYLGRVWNYEGNFAILDVDELSITVYVPDREAIYTFLLPKDAYITVPGGYGIYQVRDVVELSQVETGDGKLLARSVATGIGIPVSVTSDQLTIWDSAITYIAQNNYKGIDDTIDLSKELIFVDEVQSDRSEISVVDTKKIANLVAELLWEKQIIDEKLTVGVFNASGTPGLASSVTHMLETMGIHVVDITNWDEQPIEGSCKYLVLEHARDSVTMNRLTSVMNCSIEYSEEPSGRFDIKLILNELPL